MRFPGDRHLLQAGEPEPEESSTVWSFWTTVGVHGVGTGLVLLSLVLGVGTLGVLGYVALDVVTLVVVCMRASDGDRPAAVGIAAGAVAMAVLTLLAAYVLVAG